MSEKLDPREPFIQMGEDLDSQEVSGICTICGGPEPCRNRACLDALSALADYFEEEIF